MRFAAEASFQKAFHAANVCAFTRACSFASCMARSSPACFVYIAHSRKCLRVNFFTKWERATTDLAFMSFRKATRSRKRAMYTHFMRN
jgi:hypothetical protein